jgi:hypothetical protein
VYALCFRSIEVSRLKTKRVYALYFGSIEVSRLKQRLAVKGRRCAARCDRSAKPGCTARGIELMAPERFLPSREPPAPSVPNHGPSSRLSRCGKGLNVIDLDERARGSAGHRARHTRTDRRPARGCLAELACVRIGCVAGLLSDALHQPMLRSCPPALQLRLVEPQPEFELDFRVGGGTSRGIRYGSR